MATKRTSAAVATPALRRRGVKPEAVASYFASGADKTNVRFVSSGCGVMDEALGGGYALGRVVNIVGDRSSGKTLKAMELCANMARQYPDAWIRYAESEAAFDEEYAAALGVPIDRITFNTKGNPLETVEDWFEDLEHYVKKVGGPGLYILDSLDALSDSAELGREFDEGTYGGTKPKQIGKLFRLLVEKMEAQGILLLVVSQVRDKLNVTFGETKTRSGGKALDFYASHIVWLAEIEKLKRTIGGVERIIGVKVEAYVKKNKVGLPFRRVRYPILFGYGIDDMTAACEWLIDIGRERLLHDLGMRKKTSTRAKTKAEAAAAKEEADVAKDLVPYPDKLEELRNKGGEDAQQMRRALNALVHEEWGRIELTFLPKASKY